MHNKTRVNLILLILTLFTAVPVFAGSAVIGSVAGSLNATVGGQKLMPNAVIFSGDSLQVKDGAAVVAMENGSRMAFGRDTEVSFLRDTNEVTILLGQGNVSLYHPQGQVGLRVKVADLTVTPEPGFKTLGDVAMLNGAVMVTAKQGALKVEGNGQTQEVAQGKSVLINPKSARAPQAGGSQKLGGTDTLLDVGGLAAGVVAAILAGISISRADNATSAANSANSTAAQAVSAANAANSSAAAAGSNAVSVGCALNNFNDNVFGVGTFPSPFTPPAGSTCP